MPYVWPSFKLSLRTSIQLDALVIAALSSPFNLRQEEGVPLFKEFTTWRLKRA